MLTEEQKKRLAALHIKDAAALTEQEQKELAALTTMAEVDGLSIDDAFMAQYGPTEDRPLTGDELKKHISDAVTEGLKHYSGNMDVSKLAEEITKSLNIPDTGKGIAPEDLKSAVASALSAEAIIESLQSKLPTVPGEDQIKKLVEEVVNANLRNQSKNFYPVDEDINVPLSGHKGNLSVAEYQLLNICKMTGKVIDAKNIPTDINDGIPESIRKSAEQAGAKFVQSLRMGRKDVFTTGDGHIFPSDLSSTLLYRLYLESQLAAALISQEIPMPTDPYTLPIATTRIKYRKGSEAPATTTADKIGLSDVTLKTAKLIGITDFSYEAAENSIIPVLPMLMDDLAKGAVESLENAIIKYSATGVVAGPLGAVHPTVTPFQAFETKDNYVIAACGNNRLYAGFCNALGCPELIDDPRFDTNMHRNQNLKLIGDLLTEKTRTKTTAEWLDILEKAGVPCTGINTVDKLFTDPQVAARNMLIEVDQPGMGKVKIAGNPVKMASVEADADHHPAPALGDSTRDILVNMLGGEETKADEYVEKFH